MKEIKWAEVFLEEKINEYRSLPFWSWNDELEEEELIRQIRWMKQQGFGGFFMHARGGLRTEYLGEKWFSCIRACMEEGARLGLRAWAYDENGWPSGFVGGKLLENEENRDRYLTYSIGERSKDAFVSYLIEGERLVRGKEREGGEYVNVFKHVSASTVDILNKNVVKQFIQETHEQYKEKVGEGFGDKLKGFFTDEPQYFRSQQPYSRMLEAYFRKEYGEDVLDGLGLLFIDKEGYRAFRYKYWKAIQSLMLDSFAKQTYAWCSENGLRLTGHYIEETALYLQMSCNAGIMPFYAYEHIPGIDKLKRTVDTPVAAKQVSSVAKQLGKKQVLTETFAMCGWDVTPKELKMIAEGHYVNGVNLLCQHLLPYSERGQAKRDYPAHYSWVNPWVRHNYKGFNDYFARLGYLLGESEEMASVGVFVPIRSKYFTYKRENFRRDEVDVSYEALVKELSDRNVFYHLIDETILAEHGSVNGNTLCIGGCKYRYVIFPKTLTMDRKTKETLEKFYASGGGVLFMEGVPEYVEGEPTSYEMQSNVTLEEIIERQPIRKTTQNEGVWSTYRILEGKPFLYVVNTNAEKEATVEYEGDFQSFVAVNIENLSQTDMGKRIFLAGGQSMVLFLSQKECTQSEEKKKISLSSPYEIIGGSDNYCTLDKLKYSFDGVRYSDRLRYMGVFQELLKKEFVGKVYLKYEFMIKRMPSRIRFLAENGNCAFCRINGEKVYFDSVSDFEKQIRGANIFPFIQLGRNEVVLEMDFYQNENVYYVLHAKNITESLKNCLTYDMTIESCYLQGDFGVYANGELREGREPNVWLCEDDFYLDTLPTSVTDTVREGYPFFAGHLVLRKEFISDGEPCVLRLDGRYHLCEVKINGRVAPKSYFGQEVDISDYVKKGKNTAEITLYSSNRNLLGPHHLLAKEEPFDVAPRTFELLGSWENGKSTAERDNYSFVKFGLK